MRWFMTREHVLRNALEKLFAYELNGQWRSKREKKDNAKAF